MFAKVWLASLPAPSIAAAALFVVSLGVGSAASRLLGLRRSAVGTEPLVVLPLGLGILSIATYGLGVIDLLRRGVLIALLGAAAVVAIAELGARFQESELQIRRWPWPEIALGGALFAFGFAYASLPPFFYDALVYHLALPARYLASGSIAPPPNLGLAGYPQSGEMLSALAMSLGGERAAQMFNYLVAWGLVGGLWSFLERNTSRLAAGLGVLLIVGAWPFWMVATCSKDDLLGALFLLGSLVALIAPGTVDVRRASVAGLLAGLGCGTKYTNLAAALGLLVVAVGVGKRAGRAKVIAGFGVALVLAGALWPARNAVAFGNPVYPLLGRSLGSPRLTERGARTMSEETGQAMDRTVSGIAHRLATLGLDETAFGSGGTIPPILLPAMLLGAFATRRRNLRIGLLLGAGIVILGVAFLTVYVRTLAFGWCLGALAPAALLERARARGARALTAVLFCTSALAGIVGVPRQLEQYSAHGSAVFFGRETPGAFAERQANYLPLALGAMTALPETSIVLVVGSTRAAYLPRAAEWSYVWDEPPLRTLFSGGSTPDQALSDLERHGITHLLVNGPEMARNERRYDWLGLQQSAMRDWFAEVVTRLTLVAKANDCYLYALPSLTR